MGDWINVAKVSDIPPRSGRCVEAGGKRIGVFNVDGAFHAIDDVCTHAEASLSDGAVSGEEVACPLHFATFNLRTGRCTSPPATKDVATYDVRVNGEDVEVRV